MKITDVAPPAAADPNGAGLMLAVIPQTVGSLLAGIAIAMVVRGRTRRLVAAGALALGGGLALALTLGPWLGVQPGGLAANCGLLTLAVAALSWPVIGAHSLFGRPGLGLMAAVTLFAAMPWSAFALPHQFLPAHSGEVGQWLAPGASATLSRAVGYFPDAPTAGPWWALALWAAFGVTAIAAGRRAGGPAGAGPTPQ
ncbi:MAG: hypothetical protein LBO20_05430 [Bifidobacteriaceae bacterium]|nr:hypothetical protein [Bifidobacteriaceae bacterium]